MSFVVSAPALGAAPEQLPRQGAMNVCENVRFGGREIDNLRVPDNARCVLETGVRIDGNIELGNGSQLYASGIFVDGNVQGQRAAGTLLEDSRVGGNVQLEIGRDITMRANAIDGNIQL